MTTQNPMTEADPNSISTLFERDPQNLTRDDYDRIILTIRADRATHIAEAETAKRAGTTPKRGVAAAKQMKPKKAAFAGDMKELFS